MQTQITKEWHWSLAIGSVMLIPSFYERRGSHPMYEPDDGGQHKKEKRIYKKRVGNYSGSRQIDKDIARIKSHILKYLNDGNNEEYPQVQYQHFIDNGLLSYFDGSVMSFSGFYQNLRRVRKEYGITLNVRKIRGNKIVRLFDAGVSLEEISNKTHAKITDVRRTLIRYDRLTVDHQYHVSKKEIIAKEYRNGKSIPEIVDLVKSTEKYVISVLIEFKLIKGGRNGIG